MTDTPDDRAIPEPDQPNTGSDQQSPHETREQQTTPDAAATESSAPQPGETPQPDQASTTQQQSHAFYAANPQPHPAPNAQNRYDHNPDAHNPYAHNPYAPLPKQPKEKWPGGSRTGLIVACLAVGALIGGAAGGGVVGIYAANQQPQAISTSNGARNITVNNPDKATTVTAVAAKASPSVVTIATTSSSAAGTGSGIILSEDGYVLTNTHVVTLDGQVADPTLQVQDNDGRLYSATIVGTDPIVDLAVIKLKDAEGLTPADFADSGKLNVGDMAIAIGAPLGLSGTVTDGIVSALNRSISIQSSAAPKGDDTQQQQPRDPFNLWNFDLPGQPEERKGQQRSGTIYLPVIQTDAAINPGNSGGALLNGDGKVIGVNVAIASASHTDSGGQTGSIGVGFAVPSNLAKRVAEEIIDNGTATHGLLGATVQDAAVDSSITTVGARIHSVTDGGAADKAGLREGDVVTNFNGVPITSSTDLTAQVRYLKGGATADLTYQRDGKNYTVTVTLGTLNIT